MTRAEKNARSFWHRRRPENRRLLVKVQVSLFASQPHQVLIYTEDRFVKWEGTASRAVLRFMGQELKRYAWAHLTKDGKVSLDYYAPKQDW